MSQPAERNRDSGGRRPFQFSLASLLWLTFFFSVFLTLACHLGALGVAIFLFLTGVLLTVRGICTRRKRLTKAGVCAGIVALLVGALGSQEAVCDGYSRQPITFVVMDQTAESAVPNTSVRIRDLLGSRYEMVGPEDPVPPGENGVGGTTGGDGSITLIYRYPWSARHGAFGWRDEKVGFPWHWVQISAAGYKPVAFNLQDLIGRSRDPREFPLPPVTVKLKKSPSP